MTRRTAYKGRPRFMERYFDVCVCAGSHLISLVIPSTSLFTCYGAVVDADHGATGMA
jgi:hypothetical protein